MPSDGRPLHPSTVAVSAGRGERGPGSPMSVPVSFASTYRAGGAVGYGRESNPAWEAFEEALGALEGGEAVSFASGMAAIAAVLETLPRAAVVVAPGGAYKGTRALLADLLRTGRLGGVRLVDITDTGAVLSACAGADLLWIESPTNPLLDVADVPALCAGAAVPVVVDNTFATPLLQRPLFEGATVVVHSATKLLSGHSDVLLGAVVVPAERPDLLRALRERRELAGAVPGPMEAFLALRGMRTLAVRLERAQASARVLTGLLGRHPGIERVRYPGWGSVVSFEVRGGAEPAEELCAGVRVAVHTTSLGGVETTLERRARYPGEEAPPGLIRMSVGLEHPDDLWADLEQALAVSRAASRPR